MQPGLKTQFNILQVPKQNQPAKQVRPTDGSQIT